MSEKPESHWNYRIVTGVEDEERWFMITEVHYRNNAPWNYAESGATVWTNELEEITAILCRMKKALVKPLLDADNWPQEYKGDMYGHEPPY